MTALNQEATTITATVVAEAARLEFYPSFLGKYFMAGENLLYVHADRFVEGYTGGYWNFYTLSNGGFFAALDSDEKQHLVIPDNYCSEVMGAEAAGVTLTLMMLGRLLCARIPESESERLTDLYYKLRAYAVGHPEGQAILTAID
ncbi:antirestriction protein (plasmid) [Pseudomonas sp. WOUb67]|uniref:antirestriction protein n=1 Tax=Pseudomonas sp. WOUb67 TaxID=3161136 RepID=UPI003CF24707